MKSNRTLKETEESQEKTPQTFIPETSRANFELTEQEVSRLDSLLQWQDYSSKSTVILGNPLDI
jgi:hypothetical protein